MQEDPFSFYNENKKIRNLEKNLLTFGSLSLSYSFCSPYRIASSIIEKAKFVRAYHELMLDTSDENHKLEEWDNSLFDDSLLEQKCQSLIQDLRGNKIPLDLIRELQNQIRFNERSDFDDYGLGTITKENLIDTFYVFFGSKIGSDFVERWKNGENKEKLKRYFKNQVYENPYVNLNLINLKLKDFGSERHLSSARNYLEDQKKYPGKNIELDFGLQQ
jgi:hypothetical protein